MNTQLGPEPVAWLYRYANDPTWHLTASRQQAHDKTHEVQALGVITRVPAVPEEVVAALGDAVAALARIASLAQKAMNTGVYALTKGGRVMALWIQNITDDRDRSDDEPHDYAVRVNREPVLAYFEHVKSHGAAACLRAAADAIDAAGGAK